MRPLVFMIVSLMILSMSPSVSAMPISLNSGVEEWVSLADGSHAGVYPYVSGSTSILAVPNVTLSPSLGVEWCPEFDRWGFIGGVVTDLPIANGLGFDTIVGFSHDQSGGDWKNSDLYLALGTGLSIFTGPWSVSPSLTFYFPHGGYISPAVNLGYTF